MNIIAEVGSNWNDIPHSLGMIHSLADIGVRMVKFQLFQKKHVITVPEYWDKVIDESMAQQLVDCGNDLGIEVFFSVCYPEAVDICERIGVKRYKVRYVDRFNYEIIDKVIATGKNYFVSGWNLYCVPKYPAEIDDYPYWVFGHYLGYSDHTHHNEGITLLEHAIRSNYPYHELHVKENDECLEWRWSKNIDWIKRVLEKYE